MPPDSVLGLGRAAGNQAVSGLLQRAIRVGNETYPSSNLTQRDFRRQLMIELHREKFAETGTSAMWQQVDDWLNRQGPPPFENWTHLIKTLFGQGLLLKKYAGLRLGPKNLGERPRFSAATTSQVPTGEGENIRHIISSSTLGKAIEDAPANLTELNAWLHRHQHAPVSAHVAVPIRAAKMQIWWLVHNHLGNLFPGEGGSNQASGLLRGPLLRLEKGIREDREISWDELKPNLPSVPRFNAPEFKDHWKMIMDDLEGELEQKASEHQGRLPGAIVKTLIRQYVANLDLDLPQETMNPGYFAALEAVFVDIKAGTQMFEQNGALDRFMGLSWR